MTWFRWLRREDDERQLRREVEAHLAERVDDLRESGLSKAEARTQARREFGNAVLHLEDSRQVWHWRWLDDARRDAQYAVRSLGRTPGFTAVAVLTLALGIGLTTALFSVIDSALVRPLPYPDPEQLVEIEVEVPERAGGSNRYAPSLDDVRQWRGAGVLSHVGAGDVDGRALVVDSGIPERVRVGDPTEDFLETYGINPLLGRNIGKDDTRQGAPAVAVLGHSYWASRFSGTNVLGRDIRIENQPATIIGVLPPGFYPGTAVWRPQQYSTGFASRRGSGKSVIGRLKPGVSLESAAAELTRIAAPDVIQGPTPVAPRIVLVSLYDRETERHGTIIQTLAWAVGLILLIACVNVTGLLLARGAARQGELAIRASIGAGRGRLIRQMLTESLILATTGAALGIFVAWVALDALVAILPLLLPENSPAAVNVPVMLAALATAGLTAIAVGLMPAWSLSRAAGRVASSLSISNRRVGVPLSRRRGQVLVAIQVALALVLLSGAGLAARSLARLLAVDIGFDPDRVLAMKLEPIDQSAEVRAGYYRELVLALRMRPDIEAAGALDEIALRGGGSYFGMRIDTGAPFDGPQRTVVPGYFEALGVRAIAGRLLNESDSAAGADGSPIVVNRTAVQRYFADGVLGRSLHTTGKNARTFRIVGVVADIRHNGPMGRVRPEMYMLPGALGSSLQSAALAVVLRVRPGASVPDLHLRQLAESIGPRVLVDSVQSGSELVGERVALTRNRTLLFALLGLFGLALTLVGVFSVTVYSVARRTREIGIRVAFGARPGRLVSSFIGDSAKPAVIGIAGGWGGAYYATRILGPYLFETSPGEPMTLAIVTVLLGTSVCLAAWIPARRATRVDPVTALRAE
jgi:predicted permease